MRKRVASGGLLGALLWLVPSCSSPGPGACQSEADCGAGEYCALGICKRPLGTTGPQASAASSASSSTGGGTTGDTTGAATSGSASGGSTGVGSSTGSSTGNGSSGTGTTGGTSSGAGSTGSSSGGTDAGSSVYCKPCTQQSDCGAIGNICDQLLDGNDYCLTDCSQTGICTEAGAVCLQIEGLDSGVLGTDCIPLSNACPTASDGGTSDGGGNAGDGGDVYCQPCTQNSDCGEGDGGALCVTPDEVTFFCAPQCTATGECSEASATCYPLEDGSGDVCAPTSGVCPTGGDGGVDDYCLECSVDTDCGGNGAVCTTLDGVDYFCAPDCTATGECSDVGAECDAIEDVNGNESDGCVPSSGICDD